MVFCSWLALPRCLYKYYFIYIICGFFIYTPKLKQFNDHNWQGLIIVSCFNFTELFHMYDGHTIYCLIVHNVSHIMISLLSKKCGGHSLCECMYIHSKQIGLYRNIQQTSCGACCFSWLMMLLLILSLLSWRILIGALCHWTHYIDEFVLIGTNIIFFDV
jgi:hypothetical protein